ncbi:MAG: PA2778 family cysteine peptidase [Deltaproteobacteria bacterium]|nr:PA2778 family cysteine peptidase [Deltaproteobacteria bacterium]
MPSKRILNHLSCLSLILLLIAGLFFGCTGVQKSESPVLPENLSPGVELEKVPFYPQKKYQCGPSSLAMALTYSDMPITPEALESQVYTPSQKGSLQMAMIGATRRQGRIAYPIHGLNSLWPELAAGHPVIVLQNLGLSWMPVWHYAVVIGYDFPENYIILRSGVTERKKISFATFEKTWAHSDYWGMLVLKPTQLPAITTENEYLAAVYGLEKTQQNYAAIQGYQTALTRWPKSLVAFMGMGNSRNELGDLHGAEDAFKKAIQHHPNAAVAYNNLAEILSKQGRKPEAVAAAQKAVAIGGPMKEVYESTLLEIQSK